MTDESDAVSGPRSAQVPVGAPRVLAWGGGVALGVFLMLLAFQSGHFWRYVAWTDFQLFQPRPDAGGELVDLGEGRLGLSPQIRPMIEGRFAPKESAELAALRAEAREPFGGEAAADEWLARVSSVTLLKATSPFEVRVLVAMTDAERAARFARMLGDGIFQYSARRRIDEQVAEVERLFREIQELGDKAPPELRVRLREANMVVGPGYQTVRRKDASYLSVGAKRKLIGWRLAEASVSAGLGAMLAGIATAAVVGLVGRLRRKRG